MSPAAPEATNRASTTPRRDGVARLAGRGGEVATATGRLLGDRCRPGGGFQMAARPGKRSSTPSGVERARNRSGADGVTTTRHRHGRVGMRLRRAAVGVALVALVVMTGCTADRDSSGGGGAGGRGAPAGRPG